ncbi:hypothetical protein ACQ4M3_20505 [Leptolyngbya sp. AN03gr2]|uniref:hypothetical protein n=1 Tax=unclassified Leptolyngbya TaxID=2650499 RepID=UPI003D31E3B0
MTDCNYLPVKGKTTVLGHPMYRHRQKGDFYGGLNRPAGPIYYPVDASGEPIDPPTNFYGASVAKIVSPLDPNVVGEVDLPTTRRYALENEAADDLLNHPSGIGWV